MRMHIIPRNPKLWFRAALGSAVLAASFATAEAYLRIGIVEQDVVCLPGIAVVAWRPSTAMPGLGDLYAFRAPALVRHWALFEPDQIFVKRVAGLPGDLVEIGLDVTRVNGRIVAHGLDLAGKLARDPTIFARRFLLAEGEVLLLGETRDSLDGRYFGGVKIAEHGLGKGWALW